MLMIMNSGGNDDDGDNGSMALQRQVSPVGDGAKWRITNLPQVLEAMAKWA
jgi:hypothetical protein